MERSESSTSIDDAKNTAMKSEEETDEVFQDSAMAGSDDNCENNNIDIASENMEDDGDDNVENNDNVSENMDDDDEDEAAELNVLVVDDNEEEGEYAMEAEEEDATVDEEDDEKSNVSNEDNIDEIEVEDVKVMEERPATNNDEMENKDDEEDTVSIEEKHDIIEVDDVEVIEERTSTNNDEMENKDDEDGAVSTEEKQDEIIVDDVEVMEERTATNNEVENKDDEGGAVSTETEEKQEEIEIEEVEVIKENPVTNNVGVVDNIELARRESEGMNQEELFSQLESNHVSLKSEHDSLKSEYENQSNKTQELETIILKLRKELSDNAKVIGKNALDEEDVKLATERNQRLQLEGDALREEISRLTESNSTLQKDLCEMQADSTLTSSSVMPLKLELDRVKNENETITNHSSWLEQELEQRNEIISSLKSTHSDQIIQLQSQNDNFYAEKETVQSRFTSLQRDVESTQEQISSLHHQKLEMQQQHADALFTKEEELSAATQMSTLLRQKNEELNYRFEDKSNECNSILLLVDKTTEERDALQNQLSEEKQALVQTITDRDATLADVSHQLRLKNDENEKLTNDLNLLISNPPQNSIEQQEETAMAIVQPEDRSNLPLTITDLLDRLSDTETKLNTSNSNNRRLELYLQRVKLDIEQKAPKLNQQRKEYEIALEGQQRANEQFTESLRELEAAKEEGEYTKLELKECKQNLELSTQESHDLAVQVQSLLREKCNEDDLIEIGSISDLQHKNQRLVKEYRTLSKRIQELQTQLDDDTLHSSLEAASEELDALKKEQKHQESIISGIVQQRDLYRALLSEKDEVALKKMERSANATAVKVDEETSKELVTLRTELVTTQNECQSLSDRNARLDTLQSDFSTSLTKYQHDLTAANTNIAKAQAEKSFYKQRYERLEKSYENIKRELEFASQKSKEIQEINSKMEKIVSDSKSNVLRHEQDLRQVQAKLRLLETHLQASKVSETRLRIELEKVQEDAAKQVSLQQSLQKIELSLSSKSNVETQSLKDDVTRLASSLTTEREKHVSDNESMMDRIRDYELQVMNLQKIQHDSSEKYLKHSEDIKELESNVNIHKKKSMELEQELIDTKASLATVTSGEEVIAKAKYDTLQLDFDATKSELVTVQQRIKEYQTAARNAEEALAELQTASNEYKDRTTKELQELRSAREVLKKSLEEKGQMIQELTKDLFTQQKEQKKGESSYKEQIVTLSNDLESKKQEAQQMCVHMENMTNDLLKLRDENSSAQQNYERELGLHANARTELRTTKAEIDVEQQRRTKIEKELKTMQLNIENEKKELEEKEKSLVRSMEDAEKRLDETRKQNSLLHNQLSSLTATLDKAQNVDADEAMDAATSIIENTEEIAQTKKSMIEYRGIVEYMRSERELMEKQIGSIQMKLKSQEAASTIAKATLDESKAEIQTLQKQLLDVKESKEHASSSIPEDSIKQSSIYKQASEQLVLLRESNIVLREQSERMSMKLETSLAEITELKNSLEPLEKESSNFEVEKASWNKERESLQREAEVWKVRVQNFVSKFNQVDLEEHEKALAEAATLKKEADNMKINKDRIEKECAGFRRLITQLNSQVTELKRANEKLKGDDVTPKLHKELEEARASMKKLTEDHKNTQTELTSTKNRVENLTKMLRNFKMKHAELLKKEADMQKLLDRERETCKKLKISLEVSKKSGAKRPKPLKDAPPTKKSKVISQKLSKVDIPSKKSTVAPSTKTVTPIATAKKESSANANTEPTSSAKQSTELTSEGSKLASTKPEKKVVVKTEVKDEKKDPAESFGASVDKKVVVKTEVAPNLESSKKAKETEPQPQDTKSNEESMRKKLLLKRKKELEVSLLNKKEEVKVAKDLPADNATENVGRKRIKVDDERKEADQDVIKADKAEGEKTT